MILVIGTAIAQAGEPALVPGTGDVYVTEAASGAKVLVDDVDTGMIAPVLVRALAAGGHEITLVRGCGRAATHVDIVTGTVARVELSVNDPGGILDLSGAPAGALVTVDGRGVGELPWSGEVGCGTHTLDVRAPGFVAVSVPLDLPAGEVFAFKVELVIEPRGAITIDVRPLGAHVLVDAAPVGDGPRTILDVLPGLHTVSASIDGYRRAEVTIDLSAGEVERAALVLVQRREVPNARRWGSVGLAAGGIAAGVVAAAEFMAANDAYAEFLAEGDDETAAQFYAREVRPPQTIAWVAAGIGTAALATGGILFFIPSREGATVGVSGTF